MLDNLLLQNQCISINIEEVENERFFSELDVRCMQMSRSLTSPGLDCQLDSERQQVMLSSIHFETKSFNLCVCACVCEL